MSLLIGKAVVVPWDFSELSNEALAKALAIVEDPTAIRVIHVAALPEAMYPGNVWETISEESISTHARAAFEHLRTEANMPELSFTTMFGDPGSTIANFAEEASAELIILPSHGRTGLKRMFLGSVAERVIRLAHCNVLVLKDSAGG